MSPARTPRIEAPKHAANPCQQRGPFGRHGSLTVDRALEPSARITLQLALETPALLRPFGHPLDGPTRDPVVRSAREVLVSDGRVQRDGLTVVKEDPPSGSQWRNDFAPASACAEVHSGRVWQANVECSRPDLSRDAIDERSTQFSQPGHGVSSFRRWSPSML